ncbi:vascular endothelial growth factor receptor 1-like [Copidosoma floridanum]|uniref:vascular endothelial growth factor receptor 1-like n=1 Tax=Copidosoma floridanum TaxID=29053 RepID=UPI0006C94151|nr:vascular endothelial growth factor receptor 1-like [Copidosoma floridanum]
MANVQMRGLQALLRWSWLFLSLYLISGCGGHKPQLNYNMTELVINEGEALEITCISVGDFKFHYPISDYYNKQIVVSDHTISEDEMKQSKTFRRPSTVVGDTGWYGCVDINKKMTDMTHKEYDDPTASWIYIYITSNTSAFVQSVWTSLNGFGCLGYQVIIPCRTTSPNFQVILKKNNKELRLGERITFDSKVGFVLKNSSRMDRGDYTCEVHQDSLSHKMEITFHSFHHCMGKLVIKKDDANPVTAGSTLKIKCAVTIKIENPYKYSWTTPQNSNSRTILVPVQEKINQFTDSITSTFILHNVTYDDEGNYSCQVKSSFGENKSANIYVYVYDPSNPFINLTTNDQNKIHINGSSVAFVAHVIAYPKPILRWIGPNGQQIESSYDYQIYYEESMSILEVHNVRKLDEGIYTLCAKNIIGEKILNFTLKVYA